MFIAIWRSFLTAQKWRWLGLMGVVFLVLAGTLYVTAYNVFVLDAQVAAQQQAETGRDSLNTVSQQHKPLLYALANDDDVRRTLVSGQPAKLNSKLNDVTLKAGLEALYLMDLSGLTVAASNYQNQVTYVGKNYSFRPYFKDAIGMLLLTLPVVYPAVMALNGGEMVSAEASTFGMSGPMCAIWFGILVVKMAEFCLITPPIGLNCFVVAGVRDDLSVQDVFKGVTPFFIADAITIALLVTFPAIVLWLPSLAAA